MNASIDRRVFAFVLLAMACVSTAASSANADEKPAPARERIGSVLGKDVYRDQLKDSPTYRDVAQFFLSAPMDKYRDEHGEKFDMTDEEIRKGVEWLTAQMQQRGGEDWERWQAKGRESQADLLPRIGEIEASLRDEEIADAEAHDLRLALRLAKLELTLPHATEAWFLFSERKFEQFLYDEYGGGRIILQQLGPEALDARRKLLLELEAAGDFEITDPALRKLAYDYWERPAHPGGFHTDRRLLAFPWSEEYQARTREEEGTTPEEK